MTSHEQYEVDYALTESERLIKIEVLLVSAIRGHDAIEKKLRNLRLLTTLLIVSVGLTVCLAVIIAVSTIFEL